jgi:hypothetical protein
MLAFDLETSGLNPREALITCAAVCDPEAGVERVFFFARLDNTKLVPVLDDAEEFMLLLDRADRLCAFNGARFDLPFIRHQLGADPARVARWRLKLHDVFEACKLALGVTFPLSALLELNGLPGKTGSGADAIQLARQGDWASLGAYCLNDTRVTHRVSSLPRIRLPRTHSLSLDPRAIFCCAEA